MRGMTRSLHLSLTYECAAFQGGSTGPKSPGPSPSRWFTRSAKWQCLFSLAIVTCIQLLCSDTERFLLFFLSKGSYWGQWGGSPKGLTAESNSFVLYFPALCRKTATPSIWCVCVYGSWRSSGYCTVLRFSRSPRVLLFVQGFIEVVKDLPRSHAPQCRSLYGGGKTRRRKRQIHNDKEIVTLIVYNWDIISDMTQIY